MTERYKLLIVDDDDAVIDYLHAALGERYDIVSTNAPEHVAELARKEAPGLILCDIDMPGIDGGDVSKELYGDAELREIPVMFLTSLVSPSDLENTSHQIGGRAAVSKQSPPEELIRLIDALLK